MEIDLLVRRMEGMQSRLINLYEEVDPSVLFASKVSGDVFKELGLASEELQVSVEELRRQNQELLGLQAQLQSERQYYRDLVEFSPSAYLVTTPEGTIREANRAIAKLLNVPQRFLVGKLLTTFVPLEQRSVFRQQLLKLSQDDHAQEWELELQPRESDGLTAGVIVTPVRSPNGEITTLRWVVRDISQPKQISRQDGESLPDLQQQYPTHEYSKGEFIPLSPHAVWQVCQGLVKLTTFSESGDEVLLGLGGPATVFGSSLTILPTYQAIALSDAVQLIHIPLADVANSPGVAQAILPQLQKRLQHSEALLSIAGQRRVRDRLSGLLLLLKQEVGETTPQGIRLNVRLTHEDLANACCSTRVTITRILGQWQREGKLTLDPKHNIILHLPHFGDVETG
jgi:PAS domain S-box-containing protein